MAIEIRHLEPLALPAPWSLAHGQLVRRRLKLLGISPCVDNGIRAWRVIWRPFLAVPKPYVGPDGRTGLRYKSRRVRTRRFAITAACDEEAAFRQALLMAAVAYRQPVAKVMPLVDWARLARARGVTLRDRYAKPALNGAREEAAALFAAGYGLTQVAEQLGVDRSTAGRWRRRLQTEDALP